MSLPYYLIYPICWKLGNIPWWFTQKERDGNCGTGQAPGFFLENTDFTTVISSDIHVLIKAVFITGVKLTWIFEVDGRLLGWPRRHSGSPSHRSVIADRHHFTAHLLVQQLLSRTILFSVSEDIARSPSDLQWSSSIHIQQSLLAAKLAISCNLCLRIL